MNPSKTNLKKKSIIRWGALAPVSIIICLTAVYFVLFFDHNLKSGLEKIASKLNGAQVDISSLKTNFLAPSLEIRGLKFTNPEHPELNHFEVGNISWKLNWNALIKAKFLIEEARVEQISFATKRTSPGKVYPLEAEEEKPQDSNTSTKDDLLKKAQNQFSDGAIGQAASFMSSNPKLSADQFTQLKSKKRIQELQTDLEQKKKQWQETISKMPSNQEFQQIQEKIKQVKPPNLNQPQEIQAALKQYSDIFNESQSKYKIIKDTSDQLNKDIQEYQAKIKEVDQLIAQDREDIKKQLHIPQLDKESLAKSLLGPKTYSKLKKYEYYLSIARKYMPAKKTGQQVSHQEALTPHKRSAGVNYNFGRKTDLPLFWLKKAVISSKANSPDESNLHGQISDLSNDQSLTNLPSVLELEGNLPSQNIENFILNVNIDHRFQTPTEKLTFQSLGQTLNDYPLVSGNDFSLKLRRASLDSKLNGTLKDQEIELQSTSVFKNSEVQSQFNNPEFQKLLNQNLEKIKDIDMNIHLTGSINSPNIKIESSLVNQIQDVLNQSFQQKISELQNQINKIIDDQIGTEKSKLQNQINLNQKDLSGIVSSRQADADKTNAVLNETKNKNTNEQKKKLEELGKQKLNDLKKSFGF